ncbi:MAG: response regulator [Desulfococcaceae bacterium]
MQHILIAEDEIKIARLLRDYLVNAGYTASCMDRGDTVVPFVKKEPPDLILLDIMLPGMEGTEICREIRKFSNVPIIMITAKVEEIDRIVGLELGADDYICKPFSPREVMARVKAVLRRSKPEISGKQIRMGPVHLDEEKHTVSVNGNPLNLTPIEYSLLKIMLLHPDRVFSRADLISKVQGYDFEGYERTIDSHIKNLRKKIGDHLPEYQPICSVYGIGYKFTLPDKEG